VIDVAARLGAFGWKVNGAGGDGGSMTVLSPTREAKDRVDGALSATGWQVLPFEISPTGLEVRGTLSSDAP
jgi:mevalonate kinase